MGALDVTNGPSITVEDHGENRIRFPHLDVTYEELDRAIDAYAEENPERALIASIGGGDAQVFTINTVLFLIDEVANLRDALTEAQEQIDGLNVEADYLSEATDNIGDTLSNHLDHGYHAPRRYGR